MNFEWILFDADHTLFDFDKSAEESLSITMKAHGVRNEKGHWELYSSINKQCWRAYENGEIDRETMRTRRFIIFFESIGVHVQDVESFATEYLLTLPTRPYLFQGTLDLLGQLHPRIKLGLITNGLKEVQRPRIVSTGIDKYFEVIVISGEIDISKPSYAFFDYTHVLMSRPERERVLVVGDSLNADIKGGAQFGFKTCWYNPDALENEDGVRPDYEIDKLSEVYRIIG